MASVRETHQIPVHSDIYSGDAPDEHHDLAKYSCHDGNNDNDMVSSSHNGHKPKLISSRKLASAALLLIGAILLLLTALLVGILNMLLCSAAD